MKDISLITFILLILISLFAKLHKKERKTIAFTL